jgi:hypothetical protein
MILKICVLTDIQTAQKFRYEVVGLVFYTQAKEISLRFPYI